MAGKQDGGDKTEQPTAKRLRDARLKGDVAKSKDVGAAFSTLAMCLLFALAAGHCAWLIAGFAEDVLRLSLTQDFGHAAPLLATRALWLLVGLSATILAPLATMGLAIEFFQTGPLLTGEKLKPSLDKLNPVEGLKRMFGKDGLVELVKTLAKVVCLVVVTALIFMAALEEVGGMIRQAAFSRAAGGGVIAGERAAGYFHSVTLQLLLWSAGLFLAIAVLDRLHARKSYMKKMMMSRRDIKQEHRENEGDPMLRSERRQMHQEWGGNSAASAAAGASALLVNPTHIAIALDHHPERAPIPVITAKAMGPLAAVMRDAAHANEVPIIRNVAAARKLYAAAETGEMVPEDMFEVIAEIILWARRARAGEAPMEQEIGREPLAFEEKD